MLNIQTPASRYSDPASSHEAEMRANKSGLRRRDQKRTYAALINYPGSTSAELAELSGLDRYMLARRLPELEPTYATRGELRKCGVNPGRAVEWWPV